MIADTGDTARPKSLNISDCVNTVVWSNEIEGEQHFMLNCPLYLNEDNIPLIECKRYDTFSLQ